MLSLDPGKPLPHMRHAKRDIFYYLDPIVDRFFWVVMAAGVVGFVFQCIRLVREACRETI